MTAAGASAPTPAWDERLTVPSWSWPAGLVLALLLGALVHGGAGGARAVVPYVVGVVLVLGALGLASRGHVRVEAGVLHVPGARVAVTVLGAVRALDREQTRRLRGPEADVRAYVAVRPWLSRAVQVQLEDPDDDTPYWLVGSRRPEALATALEQARGGAVAG